jgi:glycosyltransferase involved in cell wall biosynthesis
MKLSVVIPAFNEEKHIAKVLRDLKAADYVDEIIVVNDGSTDKTETIAKRAGVKVISYGCNRGKGYAMRYGAERVSGDYFVFFEGDDQLYVDDIKKIREKLKTNDMVVGKRNFDVIPWPRRVNNVLTTFALFLATFRVIRDPVSGFIGFNKKKFLSLKLRENRFNIEAEINYKAAKRRFRVAYIDERVKYHTKKAFAFNKFSWKSNYLLIAYLAKKVFRYED